MEPGSETRALLLPASVAAEQSAVAVELKFQSSGSATFALVGGHLTPGGDGLVVTIRHPLGVPPNAPAFWMRRAMGMRHCANGWKICFAPSRR